MVMLVPAAARPEPLWEIGVGAAGLAFPAYRGSSYYHLSLLPLPYLIYRGDNLRVDREGVRSLLIDDDRLELDISLNGAMPVRSRGVPQRTGMPNLDPVVELGPSLDLGLPVPEPGVRWQLRIPVRGVFALGDGLGHVGWVAHPKLALDWRNAFADWNVGLTVGPVFGDRRYHDYYYGVEPRDATPQRPSYRPRAGYSGSAAQLTLSRRRGALWVGMFVRYDNLSGAAFADSPLVDSQHSLMSGVGVAWIFAQSDVRATDTDPALAFRSACRRDRPAPAARHGCGH